MSGWSALVEVLGLPLETLENPFLGERHRRGLVVGGEFAQLLVGHEGEAQLEDLRAAEPASGAGRLGIAFGGECREVGLELVIGQVLLLLVGLGPVAPGVCGLSRVDTRSTTSCE